MDDGEKALRLAEMTNNLQGESPLPKPSRFPERLLCYLTGCWPVFQQTNLLILPGTSGAGEISMPSEFNWFCRKRTLISL